MTHWIAFTVLVLFATPALADPCTAPVTGRKAGDTVSGTVRYIGDGDSLCIGGSAHPSTWIEIRLADIYAPELSEPGGREAKTTLSRLTMGRRALCTVRRGQNRRTVSYDRLIASCTLEGRSIADLMREAGVREGGRGK